MARPKEDNPKRVRNTRFTDVAVFWMERQAKRAKKRTWRLWLQDHIESLAAEDKDVQLLIPPQRSVPTREIARQIRPDASVVVTNSKKDMNTRFKNSKSKGK